MTSPTDLPSLEDWAETRDSLQAYAKVLGAIRGDASDPHPKWWHISLQPTPTGLTTGVLGAAGRAIRIDLDLTEHKAVLRTAEGPQHSHALGEITAADLGDKLLRHLGELDLSLSPAPEKWRDEAPRNYDAGDAHRYLRALTTVASVFSLTRDTLPGEVSTDVSPVQLWPHHFDLSFEWFGARTVTHEENGETQESPAQIGFGFSTGDEGHSGAYFYATPWPFEESLLQYELPGAARWQTEGWSGSILPYASLDSAPGLAAYLRRVFELASPGLS